MRIISALSLLCLAGLLATTSDAGAQSTKSDPPGTGTAKQFGPRKGAPATAPKVDIVATHGAWQVQCSELPAAGGQPASKACGMIQQAKNEKNPAINLSVLVSKVKSGDKTAVFMRIFAPIGVYLPTGIPVEIDGAALPSRMQFTRCNPRICEAFGEASAESLNKFRKGSAAIYYLYDRPGNGYPMKISLEGFDAALSALDNL